MCWLKNAAAAAAIGAVRVLVIESKYLGKWDIDEVKLQVVGYACSLTRTCVPDSCAQTGTRRVEVKYRARGSHCQLSVRRV